MKISPPQENAVYDGCMRRTSKPRHGAGARLTELRLKAGLTQKELAEKIGVPVPNIGFWERTNTPPSSRVLPRLARTLGATVEYILLGAVKHGRKRSGGPAGKAKKTFEQVSSLSHRQQRKILEVVDALVAQAETGQ